MICLRILAVAIFIFVTPSAIAQFSFSGEATTQGQYSTGEDLPFWMYHNNRGRVSEDSNISGWISGKVNYLINNDGTFEIGGGILVDDGTGDHFFIDELYGQFSNRDFYITVGRKQQKELYNGLSSSNRSILWSLNARPLPGLQIGTNGPIFFSGDNGLGIEGSWNEYLMEEERYVSNAKLHHKNLLFVYRSKTDLEVKAGVQHFVQWGGISPEWGQQPESLNDYIKVVTGQSGDENATPGDQLNALGNHLGGYELSVSKIFSDLYMEIFYQHLFEDGSGRRLGNTPDGRYGIYLESREPDRLVNSVIYELTYTHHQSHTTTGVHKFDDYLNNTVYRSGWTYENRILGSPFFTVDPERGVINNKFTAHHLGIGGKVSNYFVNYPYKLLLSYAHNDGRYPRRYRPKQDVGYALLEVGLMQKAINLNLQLGAEYDSRKAPVYGVGVRLQKSF